MANQLQEEETFQAWKDHPLTKDFRALLLLKQQRLMEAWGRGHPMMPEEQAQAVLLGRLADLSHEDVLEILGVNDG